MKQFSFRFFTFAAVTAVLLVSVLEFSIAIGTPAVASTKQVSQSKVLGACRRTAGCTYQKLDGGGYIGCSSQVCFICRNGKCQGNGNSAAVKGGRNGGVLGGIRIPPSVVQSTSAGTNGSNKPVHKPVNVGTSNPPKEIKAPVSSGKGGGMNQSGGYRR